MPEYGTFEVVPEAPGELGGSSPGPWTLVGATLTQVTFEVPKATALAHLPPSVSRPMPAYARLLLVDAPDTPAGPARLAVLAVAGRYAMTPRNVVVQIVVDGAERALGAVGSAFGGPAVAGAVRVHRDGEVLEASVAAGGDDVARVVLPRLHAVDPAMLRWDQWLAYARSERGLDLVGMSFGAEVDSAFLSKGSTLETPAGLPRSHSWRRLAARKVISAVHVGGTLQLGAPAVQETLAVPQTAG